MIGWTTPGSDRVDDGGWGGSCCHAVAQTTGVQVKQRTPGMTPPQLMRKGRVENMDEERFN